jgi:hypothetical protein
MAGTHRGFGSRADLPVVATSRPEEAPAAGWLTIAEADKASLLIARCARTICQALQLSSRR